MAAIIDCLLMLIYDAASYPSYFLDSSDIYFLAVISILYKIVEGTEVSPIDEELKHSIVQV